MSVISKNFDEVLVDEDTQLEIFAFWQVGNGERRFSGANPQGAGFWVNDDGQPFVIVVGEELEAKALTLGLFAVYRDLDLIGVMLKVGNAFGGGAAMRTLRWRDREVGEGDRIIAERVEFTQRPDTEAVVFC